MDRIYPPRDYSATCSEIWGGSEAAIREIQWTGEVIKLRVALIYLLVTIHLPAVRPTARRPMSSRVNPSVRSQSQPLVPLLEGFVVMTRRIRIRIRGERSSRPFPRCSRQVKKLA